MSSIQEPRERGRIQNIERAIARDRAMKEAEERDRIEMKSRLEIEMCYVVVGLATSCTYCQYVCFLPLEYTCLTAASCLPLMEILAPNTCYSVTADCA